MSGLARAREGGHLYLPQLYLKENLSNFKGKRVRGAKPLEAIGLMDFKSRFRGNWRKRCDSIQQIGMINRFLEVKIFSSLFLAVREQRGQAALQGRGARSPGQSSLTDHSTQMKWADGVGWGSGKHPASPQQWGRSQSSKGAKSTGPDQGNMSLGADIALMEVWCNSVKNKVQDLQHKRSPQRWGEYLQTLLPAFSVKATGCPLSSPPEPR